MNITYAVPKGMTKVTLPDGTTPTVLNGSIVADSIWAPYLIQQGIVPTGAGFGYPLISNVNPTTLNSGNAGSDNVEQLFPGITIPANTLAVGDLLFLMMLMEYTNSANGKVLYYKIGGLTSSTQSPTTTNVTSFFNVLWVTAAAQLTVINNSGPNGIIGAVPLQFVADITQPIIINPAGKWAAASVASEFIKCTGIAAMIQKAAR